MKPGRLYWANDLRAFVTIAVIMLHVASTISLTYPAIPKAFILPFIFWSLVYLFFFSWNDLTARGKTASQLFSFIAQQFLTGTASHLWFVYIIVSMYLTFPFLSKWAKLATEKEYLFFLGLWLIFMFLEPYLTSYDTSFDFSYFSGYIGYIVLGNYLFNSQENKRVIAY